MVLRKLAILILKRSSKSKKPPISKKCEIDLKKHQNPHPQIPYILVYNTSDFGHLPTITTKPFESSKNGTVHLDFHNFWLFTHFTQTYTSQKIPSQNSTLISVQTPSQILNHTHFYFTYLAHFQYIKDKTTPSPSHSPLFITL